jgi:prepilin-type N-terminal cleavage/methylation domain-containing protein
MKGEKGFTITEMVSALVIFAVIAVPTAMMMTRISIKFKQTDKIVALRYLERYLNESLASDTEQYDTEQEVVLNNKTFKVRRKIEEKEYKVISVEMLMGKRTLASLKGYSLGE